MHPLKFLIVVVVAALAVGAATAAAGLFYGRERLWRDLFGPADLGPYDFAAPARTGRMNDALACPAGNCADLRPTIETPIFTVSADRVHAAVHALVAADPLATIVEDRPADYTLRAVFRTPIMRFPDTVTAYAEPVGPDGARLWLYARSQIGHYDLGTNAQRLAEIVERLSATLPTAMPATAPSTTPATGPAEAEMD